MFDRNTIQQKMNFNLKKLINFQRLLKTQKEAPASRLRYKHHGVK